MKCRYTESEFIDAVKGSKTISEVLRKIGLKATGGNFKTALLKIKKFKCDTTHFEFNSKNLSKPSRAKSELDSLLVKDSLSGVSTSSLKKKLLKAGKIENKCFERNISEWQGKPLSLHLDHVNGINNDNRLDNLRLLCPNCHSQTETFAGKKLKGNFASGNTCSTCSIPIKSDRKFCRPCFQSKYHNRLAQPMQG